MNKTKTFILFSCTVGRGFFRIQTRIKRNGSFAAQGNIGVSDYRNKPSYRNHKAASNAKKRGLGFHRISLNHVECAWHHINIKDVVACPYEIHNNFEHCVEDGSALMVEGVLG